MLNKLMRKIKINNRTFSGQDGDWLPFNYSYLLAGMFILGIFTGFFAASFFNSMGLKFLAFLLSGAACFMGMIYLMITVFWKEIQECTEYVENNKENSISENIL